MKRRNFIAQGAAGAVGLGFTGCSVLKRKTAVKTELSPMAFEKKVPKPVGTMPMGEIGKTGIKVSKFGFGSHMRQDIVEYEKEREWMIREAYDLGVNFFDVYDYEQKCFQYEPMGRFLAPIINDVVISISILPWEGRTLEEEFEHDLKLFRRDYIDMVRIHSYAPEESNWYQWEKLFKYKEQGKIHAVGIPIHFLDHLEKPLEEYPLDYVIFPFNYYHNWTWLHKGMKLSNFDSLVPKLRAKGVGVITMKPFAGDHLITPFRRMAAQYDVTGEINLAKASLRYVINSGMDIDTTLGGMYYPYHVYENVDAYFNPEMTDEERKVLKKIREKAKVVAYDLLPDHYKFLERWAPDSWDDSDLFERV
ncbi:MAG: aldo/keto reductase [Candidatus Latescibacteria bacterium]|nr:aldo/keto reductase [Candidatus Latescibacterota bacterium]